MRKLIQLTLVVLLLVIALLPASIVQAESVGWFYPEPDDEPGKTSTDGWPAHQVEGGAIWTNIQGGVGTEATDNSDYGMVYITSDNTLDEWEYIIRSILVFDTSDLPDDAVITEVTLSLYGTNKSDTYTPAINPTINIYSANPASNTNIVAEDYDSLGDTTYATAITYASWDASSWNEFTLNSIGIAAISKTGVTKFGVREASYDAPNIEPTWSASSYATFGFYLADKGVAYAPKLTITWLDIPNISTETATSIEETTATLEGQILNTGGENLDERGFDWGLTDSYGNSWTESGSFEVEPFSHGITSLSPGILYHFRAKGNNSAGWDYGSDLTFTTKPNAPSELATSNPTYNSIELDWTKGTGATYTRIRRKEGSYPTSSTDGINVYYDTGTSTIDTSLDAGKTYYYRAWSYTSPQYSDSYSQDTGTTLAIIAPTVSNNPATNVATTTARLNGNLDDDGGNTTTVYIYWGDEDGVTTPGSWDNEENLGTKPEGSFYKDITGLTVSTPYYFRCKAINSEDTNWASSTESFTTSSGVEAPTNFTAIPEVAEPTINLSWIKGIGSTYTVIRYSTVNYPSNYTEGSTWTYGVRADNSCPHEDLEPGTTIYYSAWGRSGATYSSTYATTMSTTTAMESAPTTEAGNIPSSWFLSVDHTKVEDFPLYQVFNIGMVDEFDMPANTAWFIIMMFFITVIGLAVYGGARGIESTVGGQGTYSLFLSIAVIITLMGVAAGLRIVPGFFAILYVLTALGAGAVIRRV